MDNLSINDLYLKAPINKSQGIEMSESSNPRGDSLGI